METGKASNPNELPSLIHSVLSNQNVYQFDDTELENGSPSIVARESPRRTPSVSISMPSSPLKTAAAAASKNGDPLPQTTAKFYSQPMESNNQRVDMLKTGKSFNILKEWSGRLRGKGDSQNEQSSPPVDRYFDALEGPELETLRASEVPVLPEDRKWPFLLRFPVSAFSICLGISSQANLWKALATAPSTAFLHVSPDINFILWCVAVAAVVVIGFIYSMKLVKYFGAVKREFHHPIRVNFFFAPWIALLFLAIGVPPSIAERPHRAVWYALMAPIFGLELKIYGQWMSGGPRRLSKVANPSNHLSIVGNFVGALLGASMGLREGPIFFFAVGMAHYTVLFVTLYQRLPTNETLPRELHPVFFLFVAAPSVASMAWAKIQGSFDYGSRIAYFIALFLYFSLAVRVNFFRGFRFSLAWWAYTFPMTGASTATIHYSNEVSNLATRSLSVALSAASTITVMALLISTIIHAFVFQNLFPNDNAIAISQTTQKTHKNWFHQRLGRDSKGSVAPKN